MDPQANVYFKNNWDSGVEQNAVPANTEEIAWLNNCISNGKYISKSCLPLVKEETDMEEILRQAKEKYPIGCTYRPILRNGSLSLNERTQTEECFIYDSGGKKWIIGSHNIRNAKGQWAEIMSLPNSVAEEWKPVKGEWCYYGGAWAGGTDTGFGFWEKGVIVKFDKEEGDIWRFTESSGKFMNMSCSNKSCAFRKASPEEIENYLKTIKTPIIETKEHYNETINSSTTVENSTKGTLPLYNVKKRLVLN